MKNHAQKLIEATEGHTLRPKKGDHPRVLIEVLDYLIKNFAFDHETCNEDDCGYAGTYIDVEDLHDLCTQLNKEFDQ